MSATLDSLQQVWLFRDLPRKALERLERIARARNFKSGEVIVKEGDEGVGFFAITKGKVDVTRAETKLATFSKGDCFGEMALLDNYRRSATVKATEDTETLAMSRWDFLAELRASSDLAVEMLSVLSRRVRDLDERLAHE